MPFKHPTIFLKHRQALSTGPCGGSVEMPFHDLVIWSRSPVTFIQAVGCRFIGCKCLNRLIGDNPSNVAVKALGHSSA